MTHPWLDFVSPVQRPSYASQGWTEDRPAEVGGVHHGLDLRAAVGDPVYAAQAGVVVYARNTPTSTAGNWIGIKHAGEMLTRYLHLSQIRVAVGQLVYRGQLVGLAGSTGFSSGPHLHFDVFLPAHRLLEYARLFGAPVGGFGEKTDFGHKVPGEPLIPIDRYADKVVRGARSARIPLYSEVPARTSLDSARGQSALVAAVGLSVLVAAGIYYWRSL
jgi:murein DD-endopeptidase MepM/ murein hydrolase activator NlpD